MNKQYRQGDVLIVKIDSLPEGTQQIKPDNGRTILAYGEVTGHAHAIDASVSRLFEVSGVEDKFLVVDEATSVTHEEHSAIALEPGTYQVRIQREYDDMDEVRRVAD